jgi:hypothetical protein
VTSSDDQSGNPSRRQFLATLAAATPALHILRTPGEARTRDERRDETAWQSLFDGKTLGAWKPTEFGGEGPVTVEDSQIILGTGADLTGITWTGGGLPATSYELALQAMRLSGIDFFCGLTFPVDTAFCSFILGGWSGTTIGLSSLDGRDASENETTKHRNLEDHRWYAVRLRVEAGRIQAWLDDEPVVDVKTAGRKIGIRPEVADSRPLGIASWRTRAALRDLRLRRL